MGRETGNGNGIMRKRKCGGVKVMQLGGLEIVMGIIGIVQKVVDSFIAKDANKIAKEANEIARITNEIENASLRDFQKKIYARNYTY